MVQPSSWDVEVRLVDRTSVQLLWYRASSLLVHQGAMTPLVHALKSCCTLTDAISACARDCHVDLPSLIPNRQNNMNNNNNNNNSNSNNRAALSTLIQLLSSLDEAWPRSLHCDAVDSYAAYLRGPIAAAVQGARHVDAAFAHAAAELVRRSHELSRAVRDSLVAQRLQMVKTLLADDLDEFTEDQALDLAQRREPSTDEPDNDCAEGGKG
jgi:hypothetical protein